MEEKDYYKISTEKKLPLRCPILNYCSRRALTIYLFSEYSKYDPGLSVIQALQKDGTLPDDFEKRKIDVQGEPPSIINGSDHYYFSDMCPEVNLFDGWNAKIFGKACSCGDYDKYRKTDKNKIIKSQHFSECAEFNKYLFDNNKNIRNQPKRKTISFKVKALLQKEIHSQCPFCTNQDVGHFHVHHIDENPENNFMTNLIMLCPTCHSKITKRDILMSEVIERKKELMN